MWLKLGCGTHSKRRGRTHWNEEYSEKNRGNEMRVDVYWMKPDQRVISPLMAVFVLLTGLVMPAERARDQPQRTRLGIKRDEPVNFDLCSVADSL